MFRRSRCACDDKRLDLASQADAKRYTHYCSLPTPPSNFHFWSQLLRSVLKISTEMLKLLFADTFRHTGPVQEQNSDYVKFSTPIIIRKWRIIRKGGATHQSLDQVGYEISIFSVPFSNSSYSCTFPASFKLELFVRDKNRQDVNTVTCSRDLCRISHLSFLYLGW